MFYIQTGGVRLSVLSKTGQEVVTALLGPGDFFGESCLAGQPIRLGTARAVTPCLIRLVSKNKMAQWLQMEHAMADRFIANLLSRNTRIEADLVEQLCKTIPERGVQ